MAKLKLVPIAGKIKTMGIADMEDASETPIATISFSSSFQHKPNDLNKIDVKAIREELSGNAKAFFVTEFETDEEDYTARLILKITSIILITMFAKKKGFSVVYIDVLLDEMNHYIKREFCVARYYVALDRVILKREL